MDLIFDRGPAPLNKEKVKRYEEKVFGNIEAKSTEAHLLNQLEPQHAFHRNMDASDQFYLQHSVEAERQLEETIRSKEEEELAKFRFSSASRSVATPLIVAPLKEKKGMGIQPLAIIKVKKRKSDGPCDSEKSETASKTAKVENNDQCIESIKSGSVDGPEASKAPENSKAMTTISSNIDKRGDTSDSLLGLLGGYGSGSDDDES